MIDLTDLTDLDRRAAVVMGLEEPFFTPTTEAFDCREFERFALEKGYELTIAEWKDGCDVEVWLEDEGEGRDWVAGAEATDVEHGPTFSSVARVLALLDALEKES